MANPTPVPSNVPKPLNVQPNGHQPSTGPNATAGNVRIKSEPGSDYSQIPQFTGYQPNTSYDNNKEAQQRAAAALSQKFGEAAAPQISQLTAQFNSPHSGPRPSPNPGNIQLPPQLTEQQRREYAERQRQQQARQMQQAQQAQQRPIVGSAQTDGADEWKEMVAQRRVAALADSDATQAADLTMRQRLEHMSHAMEGGGFMMPLSEQPTQSQAKKRKAVVPAGASFSHIASAATRCGDRIFVKGIPQLDGFGDSDTEDKSGIKPEPELFEEDDEDAINSDLDDPDEEVVQEEQEDGQEGQIMVCTYDKVARVKNKWKCTLKDGVLTTGGKE